MQLQSSVFPVKAEDFLHIVEVWESSARATHQLVSEPDIQFFKLLVRHALPQMTELACMRDGHEQITGFVAVSNRRVELLFMHPSARGQGGGRRLLTYTITTCGATSLHVKEQNEQAVRFYLRMGFDVVGRSERDGTGKPYPLLHLRRVDALEKDLTNAPSAWTPGNMLDPSHACRSSTTPDT